MLKWLKYLMNFTDPLPICTGTCQFNIYIYIYMHHKAAAEDIVLNFFSS